MHNMTFGLCMNMTVSKMLTPNCTQVSEELLERY